MNYLALVQRVVREGGRSSGGPATIASAVGDERMAADWVADAWRALQLEPYNWSWMRKRGSGALVAGRASYTGAGLGLTGFGRWREPSRHWQPVVTNDSARWGLRWLPLDDWLARFTAPQSNASPQYWTIDNDGSLLLGPAPDVAATIEMQYWSAPTELAADADEPNIPASYHMLLVWGALAEAGGFDSAPEMFARGAANHDRMHSMFKREFGEEIKFEVASL